MTTLDLTKYTHLAFIASVNKKYAEMKSLLIDEVITVEVLDVDEDHRAYCINPAGLMEYPFVSELMNVREVTQ